MLSALVWWPLFVAGTILAVPWLVLTVELLAGLLPSRGAPAGRAVPARPSLAVLIPAHDEEAGIADCVEAVLASAGPDARVLVVADNCTDGTASSARRAGAEVLERRDPERQGKGYALDAGFRHLAGRPPEVVVVQDADTVPVGDALQQLARQAMATGRPLQGGYLLTLGARPTLRERVSALAFTVRNLVRQRGVERLGWPSQLQGTGMAFCWSAVEAVNVASGNVVEDMQLGIDLAVAGMTASPCTGARGVSPHVRGARAMRSQRDRWEHGHLRTLASQLPRLLGAAIRQRRGELVLLGLDLAVPPLSLLTWLSAVVMTGGALLALSGGGTAPLVLSSAPGAVGFAALAGAWWRFGRELLPTRAALAVPLYVAGKLGVYARALAGGERRWQRSARPPAGSSNPLPDPAQPAGGSSPRTVRVAGVDLLALDEARFVDHVMRRLAKGLGGWIVTPNLDHLRRTRHSASYRGLLELADCRVADGMPLVWASRLQADPLPGRVAGSDLLDKLSEAAARQGRSVFLLGGNPGTAEASSEELRSRHPGLRVAGTLCPPRGFDAREDELLALRRALVAAKPDIVFVGLGSPKQERLIASLLLTVRPELEATWWIGVGVSFSFLAGEIDRAPNWMRRVGLEWLHRLAQEPARLARRYLIEDLPFFARLMAGSAWIRLRSGARARRSPTGEEAA